MRRPACCLVLCLLLVACGSGDSDAADGSAAPSAGAGGSAGPGTGGTSSAGGRAGNASAGSSGGAAGTSSAGAGGTMSAGAGGATSVGAGGAASAGGASAGAGGATSGGSGGATTGGGGGASAGAGGVSGSSGQTGTGGSGGSVLASRRGLYVSLYTDHNGQVAFTGPLDEYRNIVGDPVKEQRVLEYISAHGINAISLYDLGTIDDTPGKDAALASFMGRARKAGIQSIEAVSSQSTTLSDVIASFHQTQAPFDGIVTEIEFWNGGAVADATSALSYLQAKNLKRMDGSALSYGSYLGWVTDSDITALVPYVDRLYLHAYVTKPSLAYDYLAVRAKAVAVANAALGKEVEVVPIYSAEGMQWSAGAEHFMGDWLATGSLDAAETTFRDAWTAEAPAQLRLGGFQYFEYFFLAQYVP